MLASSCTDRFVLFFCSAYVLRFCCVLFFCVTYKFGVCLFCLFGALAWYTFSNVFCFFALLVCWAFDLSAFLHRMCAGLLPCFVLLRHLYVWRLLFCLFGAFACYTFAMFFAFLFACMLDFLFICLYAPFGAGLLPFLFCLQCVCGVVLRFCLASAVGCCLFASLVCWKCFLFVFFRFAYVLWFRFCFAVLPILRAGLFFVLHVWQLMRFLFALFACLAYLCAGLLPSCV